MIVLVCPTQKKISTQWHLGNLAVGVDSVAVAVALVEEDAVVDEVVAVIVAGEEVEADLQDAVEQVAVGEAADEVDQEAAGEVDQKAGLEQSWSHTDIRAYSLQKARNICSSPKT